MTWNGERCTGDYSMNMTDKNSQRRSGAEVDVYSPRRADSDVYSARRPDTDAYSSRRTDTDSFSYRQADTDTYSRRSDRAGRSSQDYAGLETSSRRRSGTDSDSQIRSGTYADTHSRTEAGNDTRRRTGAGNGVRSRSGAYNENPSSADRKSDKKSGTRRSTAKTSVKNGNKAEISARGADESSQYTKREWARIEAREKAENRYMTRLILILAGLALLTAVLLYATWYYVWRSHDFNLYRTFDYTSAVYGIDIGNSRESRVRGIADGLCVAGGDINPQAVTMTAQAAGLFDMNRQEVRYAKDIFSRRSPASITKVMTALLTLKYGNLDELVTVSPVALDIEYGSSVCDIHVGDVLTLRQLLYGMMVASGNDAAMVIAEHIGGSVSHFVDMMNEEARLIGATDTNFENPHGLTAENHYTTVYDIYLMFQEAAKYDLFQDIINRKNYYAEYRREDGSAVAVTWESTNYYFTKQAEAPDGISVFGGKTGTTENAGACLALMAKDSYGNPYIAVILHSDSKDTLYPDMNQLLRLAVSQ